jgi:hypothetical protein
MTWAPDYTDTASLRTYIRGGQDQDQDQFLATWITATSRNVDDFCGRQFGNTVTAQTRTYDGVRDSHVNCWIYEIDDVQNITGMTVATGATGATIQASTGFTLWPRNAVANGMPYTQLRTSAFSGTITATAVWGWNAVPAAAPTGLLLQAARLAKRRDSPFGVAGSPTDGSELRLLAQLDPDFRTTLKPYMRTWWAA